MTSHPNRSSDPYRTKYHRDGTVTVWDVYQQQWSRRSAAALDRDHRIMATLSADERARIEAMAQAYPDDD